MSIDIRESTKLKPCPFCGGKAILEATSLGNGRIHCLKCHFESGIFWNNLRGGSGTWRDKALKAWNQRASAGTRTPPVGSDAKDA